MKQFEKKIKDRLEGFESSLPEGDLSEFKAILQNGTNVVNKKRKVTPVAWLAPVAAAAVVALLITWSGNPKPDTTIISNGNNTPVAEAIGADNTDNDTTDADNNVKTSIDKRPQYVYAQVITNVAEPCDSISEGEFKEHPDEENIWAETNIIPEHQDSVFAATTDETTFIATAMTPNMSINEIQQPLHSNAGKTAAGAIGGTGVTAALIKYLPSLFNSFDDIDTSPGPENQLLKEKYYMPLRAGVSLRIPFSNRWSLTSGVDYSWYHVKKTFSISGDDSQSFHYLGIPLRVDYTIARIKKIDFYAGAGIAADFCVAAYNQKRNYEKDQVGFSLVGVGGVQYNINKNLGIYLEPTVSWNFPDKYRQITSYKSLHPVMFSISPGLRITLDNKDR